MIIHNEDCMETMSRMGNGSVDLIVTSPPYNTARVGAKDPYNSRYDVYSGDNMTPDDYIGWQLSVFLMFDKVLREDGVVLFNISYSSEDTTTMWLLIADIMRHTKFKVADCIIWEKSCALPNSMSPNKLTRIVEYVFVFCKEERIGDFRANKRITSHRGGKQANYENIFNVIRAANNDGPITLNKATYSTELVYKLLKIYAKKGDTVYDPFSGTGTTGNACKLYGCDYIGSEISKEQCIVANDRLVIANLCTIKAKRRVK